MTRRVEIDLDAITAEELDRVWQEISRRLAPRKASPDVYDALVAALPKLPAELATAVRADLDAGIHPLAAAVAHFEDKPALGAFPQPELPVPDPVAWFGAERLFLTAVTEMVRFTTDQRRIADAAVELAGQLGIDHGPADRIIVHALHAQERGADVG